MKKRNLLLNLVLLISCFNILSQDVITCTNDTIKLKTKNYKYGIIEWEQSIDGKNWQKIKGEFDTTFIFKPIKTSYYRAVNKLPNCAPIYSSKTLVQRPPVANAGSDRAINDNFLFLSGNTEANSKGNWTVLDGTNGTFDDKTNAETKFTGESGNYKLLWKLENSCGFSTDTVSVEILENTYYDKIVIVDETDKILSSQNEIENGNYTIEFNDPVPEIDTETILIGTTGNGYLRKVSSVTKTDNTFTMTTTLGKLEDILIKGGFDLSKILSLDAITKKSKTSFKQLRTLPTRKDILSKKELKSGIHYFLIDEEVKSLNNNVRKKASKETDKKTVLDFTLGGDLVDKDGIKINLKGNLNFTPNLRTEFNEDIFRPDFSLLLENSKLKNTFTFSLTGDYESNTLNNFNLFSYTKVVYILVSGVPLLITTDIDFEGKITANTKANLSFVHKFTNTITTNASISYKSGKWDKEFNSSTVNSLDNNLDISGNFIQSLEIGPKIGFKVYDVVGPYVELKLTETFKICAKSNNLEPINWNGNFDLGTKVTAGIEARGFGRKLFDFSETWENSGLYSLKFPYKLNYIQGSNQQYIKGTTLVHSPEVRITDNKGNPIQFVSVKFETDPNSSDTVSNEYVLTDADGYAITDWTPTVDNSSQLKVSVVDCNDQNISNSPLIFNATEVKAIDCSETTLSASYKIEDNILIPYAHRGKSPYTYSIDNVSFSNEKPEIALVDGRTYTIYVKDNNGCVASKSYISIPFSCDDSDLDLEISTYGKNIDVKATGGKPPYEYSTVALPGTGFKALGNSNSNNFTSATTFYNLPLGKHQITIKDANGCEKSSTINLETTNTELSAYFEYENDNGLVTFKNLSNNAESYEWDFGNGTTSNEQNPIIYFENLGNYEVSLTIIDKENKVANLKRTIDIQKSNSQKIFKGNLVLSTQFDIDNFNYNVIKGNLEINLLKNTNITNLKGLKSLKAVEGFLGIGNRNSTGFSQENTTLKSLDGLENLISINEGLWLGYSQFAFPNSVLTSISALKNLKTVGGIYLFGNSSLKSIEVFKNISFLKSDLIISNNSNLISLNGLNNIKKIVGRLEISNNPNVNSLEQLKNLNNIGSSLWVIGNGNINSIEVFKNLSTINGDLYFSDINIKNLIGLENIKSIKGKLILTNNNLLENIEDLRNIVTIGDFITISNNNSLTSFKGLNIEKVEGNLSIEDNLLLTSLSGLENIKDIKKDIIINSNTNLKTLKGLSSLSNIGGKLYIGRDSRDNKTGNPKLTNFCEISNLIRDGIISIDEYFIKNNLYNPTYQQIQNNSSDGCKG
ncbi:hypothetical protein H9I45_04845 [Polaribacter haliotis]|uniref:PKD domain-containing protein n=1 Tax=Polaribacter haliotis TaxID=1888915 RepID=A0A7L8AIE7_9FLAO|nr:PKD domain-containing protein [Polaribacter haliotis]QOD61778.1 hypothetical protein H9I45_04845 [Polaribacter haliotis]